MTNHWAEQKGDLLVRVSEGHEALIFDQTGIVNLRNDRDVAALHLLVNLVQSDNLIANPLAEIETVGDLGLEFPIIDQASFHSVDKQHTTGLESALLDNLLSRNQDSTDFGSANNTIIVGHVVSARTESVSVKGSTTVPSVRKSEESWAIPRLHQARSPFVERGLLRVHLWVILPCLGHHHHDSLRKRQNSIYGQELQHVIKSSGIRSALLDYRV